MIEWINLIASFTWLDLAELIVFITGACAVGYSLKWSYYFLTMEKISGKLSTAIGLMFLGEFWNIFNTWVFAGMAASGWVADLSGWTQAAMRESMFVSAVASSMYLKAVIVGLILVDASERNQQGNNNAS